MTPSSQSATVVIHREPEDPMALRASVGGQPALGYYLVYRGDPEAVVAMLERVLAEARERIDKPDTDKRGRPQG